MPQCRVREGVACLTCHPPDSVESMLSQGPARQRQGATPRRRGQQLAPSSRHHVPTIRLLLPAAFVLSSTPVAPASFDLPQVNWLLEDRRRSIISGPLRLSSSSGFKTFHTHFPVLISRASFRCCNFCARLIHSQTPFGTRSDLFVGACGPMHRRTTTDNDVQLCLAACQQQ